LVVTSSKDRTARVWETATGKPVGPALEHDGIVAWAQFSSDGSKLLTVRERHFVQLWDWREGRRLAPEIPRRSVLSHGSLSPDQTKVLTVAWSGYAHLYDATNSQLINQFEHQGGLVDAAFSPDGGRVAIACHDGNVWVWAVNDTARRPMLLPEGNQIEEIAFSRNGRLLAVGTRGGHARVWELAPPERGVQRLPGHEVQWLEFDPSGAHALIVSSGKAPAVSVFDVQTCKLISTAALRDEVARARFSSDGRRILAFGGTQVRVLDAASGRELVRPLVHKRKIQEAVWSPDGKLILSAAGTAGVRAWDSLSGKSAVTFPYSNSVRAIALSADGTRLASGHDDRTVQIWQTRSGRPEGPPITTREPIRELHFSPDGTRLAIATYSRGGEGIVEMRNAVSGEAIGQPLRHHDEVMAFEFSRDGSALATACNDHSARIWNAGTGEPVSPWLPHDFEARRASFAPDGKRLVTLARRGATRLWSARTGEAITAPIVYTRNSGDGGVSFSPDGKRLLIARGGKEAWLRELQPETASLEELKLRAQVISCTRFDAASGMVPLDEAGLNSAWERLCTLRARR
jgi:WD40 repeat protein